jgi:hypothetical protein
MPGGGAIWRATLAERGMAALMPSQRWMNWGWMRSICRPKGLKPGSSVSAPQVRDFNGSLETRHANQGVFVTTEEFTSAARMASQNVSKRVVLINGPALTDLMIRHCIGGRLTKTFQFKKVDLAYFQGRSSGGSIISASVQPRK